MDVRALDIPDVKLIVPKAFGDDRGYFTETYHHARFADLGIANVFLQDNHSLSRDAGVVRGLHFQSTPHAQGKLVRAVAGAIFDVAVDIRRASPTFGQHVSAVLSAANRAQLWVPPGFAHGFCTLEPDTEITYKVTAYYAPENDHGLAWDDPALGIDWPVELSAATLSPKDKAHPRLAELPAYF